jgi:hypothetical protein
MVPVLFVFCLNYDHGFRSPQPVEEWLLIPFPLWDDGFKCYLEVSPDTEGVRRESPQRWLILPRPRPGQSIESLFGGGLLRRIIRLVSASRSPKGTKFFEWGELIQKNGIQVLA